VLGFPLATGAFICMAPAATLIEELALARCLDCQSKAAVVTPALDQHR
jgi:hypothetical protein